VRTSGAKPGQMAAMVIFAFSCFGLLLFLWLSFGGPIPLKPQGYRFQVAFPEATTLAEQADVRIAGVSVGKVVHKERDPNGDRTLATIELQRKYAPIHTTAKVMLRQKTLLGETYVALTPGPKHSPRLPDDGRLANQAVDETVELDEVLQIFPKETRDQFRRWQANSAEVIAGRDRDLNDSLGNLGPFSESGADLLTTLDRRREALRDLVKNTGVTFQALTQDEDQLRAFIADTSKWFQATASEKEALAESVRIFPTFLRESRSTLSRLERFAVDTKPLVDDLGPVARDLQPTLRDLGAASPSLQKAFNAIPSLVTASKDGLPAMSRVLRGLEPVLSATGPMLNQLNPLLQWLEAQQAHVSDFIAVPGATLNGRRHRTNQNSLGSVLPQLITTGSQSMVTPTRSSDNRGNAYPFGDYAYRYYTRGRDYDIFPNWDCGPSGGEKKPTEGPTGTPGCVVQGPLAFKGVTQKFPHVEESKPAAPNK
jgi:phospholipid/cholesterol/gamma-HCH transport system substrate-binding protein